MDQSKSTNNKKKANKKRKRSIQRVLKWRRNQLLRKEVNGASVKQPSTSPVKVRGVLFGGLKVLPHDPVVDPPPRACFRCWQFGHNRNDCQEPLKFLYCYNCGRKNVNLTNCPRCAAAYIIKYDQKFRQKFENLIARDLDMILQITDDEIQCIEVPVVVKEEPRNLDNLISKISKCSNSLNALWNQVGELTKQTDPSKADLRAMLEAKRNNASKSDLRQILDNKMKITYKENDLESLDFDPREESNRNFHQKLNADKNWISKDNDLRHRLQASKTSEPDGLEESRPQDADFDFIQKLDTFGPHLNDANSDFKLMNRKACQAFNTRIDCPEQPELMHQNLDHKEIDLNFGPKQVDQTVGFVNDYLDQRFLGPQNPDIVNRGFNKPDLGVKNVGLIKTNDSSNQNSELKNDGCFKIPKVPEISFKRNNKRDLNMHRPAREALRSNFGQTATQVSSKPSNQDFQQIDKNLIGFTNYIGDNPIVGFDGLRPNRNFNKGGPSFGFDINSRDFGLDRDYSQGNPNLDSNCFSSLRKTETGTNFVSRDTQFFVRDSSGLGAHESLAFRTNQNFTKDDADPDLSFVNKLSGSSRDLRPDRNFIQGNLGSNPAFGNNFAGPNREFRLNRNYREGDLDLNLTLGNSSAGLNRDFRPNQPHKEDDLGSIPVFGNTASDLKGDFRSNRNYREGDLDLMNSNRDLRPNRADYGLNSNFGNREFESNRNYNEGEADLSIRGSSQHTNREFSFNMSIRANSRDPPELSRLMDENYESGEILRTKYFQYLSALQKSGVDFVSGNTQPYSRDSSTLGLEKTHLLSRRNLQP